MRRTPWDPTDFVKPSTMASKSDQKPGERFKIVPTVYLVLRQRDDILLARRCNTGFHDGEYSLPAGHLDGMETLVQAVVREAKEEIGIHLDGNCLRLGHVMHRKEGNEERANFFFVSTEWRGHPRIMEPLKCDDLRWFCLHKLPPNLIPYVQQAITCLIQGIAYSEYGW